ncbi:hypothetical protein HA402_009893 [Bradysia odoriphaga]|nr:hypothetical protein HA402_009893 [Bradysia odoriphaga]
MEALGKTAEFEKLMDLIAKKKEIVHKLGEDKAIANSMADSCYVYMKKFKEDCTNQRVNALDNAAKVQRDIDREKQELAVMKKKLSDIVARMAVKIQTT